MDQEYRNSRTSVTHHQQHHHHQMRMTVPPPPSPQPSPPVLPHAESDQSTSELRALDCNLTSLCDHIQSEGFGSGAFSDVVVKAMGSSYHLHRLILSRSSYFRTMLQGPWKEASSPVVNLLVDDKNVNGDAISVALAYLYGYHPKLDDDNAFRVLAAASFLDLQDLCAICTDFIISELRTSNFLAYQVFAESQDYGIHGERVRNACWGYLCQSGAVELREMLPKLSAQTLCALLTSDELWVPSEEKRFELALYAFIANGALSNSEHSNKNSRSLDCKLGHLDIEDDLRDASDDVIVPLAEGVIDFQRGVSGSNLVFQQSPNSQTSFGRTCTSVVDKTEGSGVAIEGPSEEAYHLSNDSWLSGADSRNSPTLGSSSDGFVVSEWGNCGVSALTWGGRVVGTRQGTGSVKGKYGFTEEEYSAFVNTFEGGSLLYCNMSFEILLNARKELEELGFPCKAVNDGLWLQMLLSQRVQEVAANTCKRCCLISVACACKQGFGVSHGATYNNYYCQDNVQNNMMGDMENVYVAESSQGEGIGIFKPVRISVRGQHIDGLAGIGCEATFVPPPAWPPTPFVYSRVPINRNGQQSIASDGSEGRIDQSGEISKDGLTALVGLSQGTSGVGNNLRGDQSEGGRGSGATVGMSEPKESSVGTEWENASCTISLDTRTPLCHFPPFRFGVEFEDVHRLANGHVEHSPEFFYAGSLWKISIQAFNDEDPQGRRTIGLFLHRRKAEIVDSVRKVHVFIDPRDKVTARYQLICPSKREVMLFGSFKQRGTLLPKAPKGWGWRTALLFDELSELLQNGALRVAAVVQLV
ncbi:SKP1/BTB/POZ domain superfamily [Arabidopsis thaliana x Arabidopsis arenosa]|uniref:SKP1/BTB/POZ domain superfamily n=1 Tax=Arabidopsis thaliana x Arabidopsis arenosa TaxID=1240361 RepID=A0A8T1YAF9_9BRAS|nr:SKP1/BTB/POZ domain superfamily [Arabidopsis thaliana x Arabidopsis arenosa]